MLMIAAVGAVIAAILIIFTVVVVTSVIKPEEEKEEVPKSREWTHIKDFEDILSNKNDDDDFDDDVKTVGAEFLKEKKKAEEPEEDAGDFDFSAFKEKFKTVSYEDMEESSETADLDETVDLSDETMADSFANSVSVTLKYKDGEANKFLKMVTPQLTVGRAIGNDLLLNGYGYISKNHALFTLKDNKLYLKDLNSKNGTFVEGKRIEGEVCLEESCDVAFGRLKVEVIIAENGE